MHIRSRILIAALATLPASASFAQSPRTASSAHTTIEIVTAAAAVEPGTDSWIAVRFLLEPGWHIYWRNPGDSGAPPLLLWTTPAGVSIGDVEWPAPERIPYGTLVNYGYHGDVILPMRLRSTARVEGPLSLNASWLVCKDVCVQGKARVAVSFPLEGMLAGATADWSARIAEARRRVPGPLPKGWSASAVTTPTGFEIRLDAPTRVTPVSFFSIDESVIEEAVAPVVTPLARGARVALKKPDTLSKSPARLRGVLTLDDGAAFELVLPLSAQAAGRRSHP